MIKRLKKYNLTFMNYNFTTKHIISENHIANFKFKVLHLESKSRTLNLLECAGINKFNKKNLAVNYIIDISNSPLLILF